mgnify:CR=1 FL=1
MTAGSRELEITDGDSDIVINRKVVTATGRVDLKVDVVWTEGNRAEWGC